MYQQDNPSAVDQGKISNVALADGPLKNKRCTDCFCLLIFTAFLAGTVFALQYAFTKGDPSRLIQPFDPDHTPCGKGKAKDYPFIYFADPLGKHMFRDTVCVKECPRDEKNLELDCLVNSVVKSCKGEKFSFLEMDMEEHGFQFSDELREFNSKQNSKQDQKNDEKKVKNDHKNDEINDEKKVEENHKKNYKSVQKKPNQLAPSNLYIYPSVPVATACLPSAKNIQKLLGNELSVLQVNKYTEMFNENWKYFVGAFAAALILSLVFVNLLRYFTGLFTWIVLLAFFLIFPTVATFFLVESHPEWFGTEFANLINSQIENQDPKFQSVQQYIVKNKDTFTYAAFGLYGVTGLLLILIVCFARTIRLSIGVIKAACIFIDDNLLIYLIPFTNMLALAAYWTVWMFGTIYMLSLGHQETQKMMPPYGQFSYDSIDQMVLVGHLFAFIWISCFIDACSTFIFGATVAEWYYKTGSWPVFESIKNLTFYHIGSVAMGSFIITLIKIPQIILAAVKSYTNNTGQQNQMSDTVFKCCECCLNCFERFIEYINQNAYVLVAMEGKNFLTSAYDAFMLIIRNPLSFGMAHTMAKFFSFMGVIIVGALTYLFSDLYIEHYAPKIDYLLQTQVVMGCIGLIVGYCFIGILAQVADDVLVIFMIDNEVQKYHYGQSKGKYTPEPLQDLVEDMKQ